MNIKKILKLVFDLAFFLAGGLLILIFAYRFGWVLLKGPLNWGNDLPFALSYIYYLERWWPQIPLWHYEWAGGMPLLQNYPFLITYITSWTHHLTNLTIIQAARFYLWLSLPLTGIGIAVLTKLITKNWLAAILAGIFSLLSPDPWLWIMQGGFYASATSVPWMVFAFIFFELAFQKEKRFWWVLTVIFLGLAWISHPRTGMTTIIVLGIYGLGKGIIKKETFSVVLKTIVVCLSGVLLVTFWVIPLLSSRSGGTGITADYKVSFITIPQLLGLGGVQKEAFISPGFFSGPIWVLAGLGLIFALIRRSKILITVAVCALVGIFLVVGPGYVPWLLKGPIRSVWGSINVRAITIPRLFLPILAAYGALSFGEGIFLLIARWIKSLRKNFLWQLTTQIVGGAIALALVLVIFQKVVIIPENTPEVYFYQGYGPVYDFREPEFPSFMDSFRSVLNLKIDDASILAAANLPRFIEEEGLTENDRIDMPPPSGAIMAAWNIASGISQVNPYVGASLITPMFGYERACMFYLDHDCSGLEVQSLAKWWGLKAIYLGMTGLGARLPPYIDEEMLTNLKKAGFKEKTITTESLLHFTYEIPEATGLATITNKPLILVIGDNPPVKDGFRTAFTSFNRSDWNYDQGMLISGKRHIDDYSLKELKKFPIVVLYGYQAHNQKKAWDLLTKYVEQGGNLFVETGWQYWSEDWGKVDSQGQSEAINLPELLPIIKLKWGNIGTQWQDLQIAESNLKTKDNLKPKLTSKGWSDLVWQGKPWGMSLAELGDIRKESFPLLTTANKVVVAGKNFGKGKVVWSGINLFGHTAYYQNEPENKFLGAIFSWFIPKNKPIEENLNFKRQTPDEVIINVDKTVPGAKSVMFKEVASPGWRAFWQTENKKIKLPILKAGPGWKLVQLPENTDQGKILMTYSRTPKEWFSISLSIITALGLLVFLIDGLFNGKILKRLRISKIGQNFSTDKIKNLIENWKAEEE